MAGPSQSGKTSFIMKCLEYKDVMFSVKFDVIYYYLPAESQYSKSDFVDKMRDKYPFVQVHYGLPLHSHIYSSPVHKLW